MSFACIQSIFVYVSNWNASTENILNKIDLRNEKNDA